MRVATGKVINGTIVLEGADLPEGSLVAVFTMNSETMVRLPPAQSAELDSALDEADREEGIPASELCERLDKYG